MLKVAPGDREAVAGSPARLAGLVDGPLPAGWQAELDAKADRWKLALYRRAQRAPSDAADDGEDGEPSDELLDAQDESGLGADDVDARSPRAAPSSRAASPPPSRTRRRCCSPGSCAPACRSAAATCAACSGRAR